jgi:hypothetical protein
MASQYGYASYYKPPKQPTLAQAAAAKDPYGLAPNNRSGPLGIGSSTGFAAPSPSTVKAPAHVVTAQDAQSPIGKGILGLLPNGSQAVGQRPAAPPTAQNAYDLNTDPALQQINALVGLNDQQATAAALKQKQDLLLAFGDPTVAAAVLGQNDPLVQAAAQNPTSTVNQLGQQRDQNLKSLLDQLNPLNLDYSGYRVTQEQQNQTNFQNALAQAAAGLNSNLDQVTGNLNSALSANAATLAQAISAAQDRASQQSTTTGTDPGATTGAPGPTDTGRANPFANTGAGVAGMGNAHVAGTGGIPAGLAAALGLSPIDAITQAVIAAGQQRKQQQLAGLFG